ncbi:PH domain-containing protein [Consotaella aegiceratis]|uniref:PH domain-containing protein n=1 Tax=Consotaella aegiceratis TaxID=3097961 RepID=UPI002F405CB9
MGLLAGLLGLSSDVDIEAVRRELEPILIPSEEIELAFAVVRDLMVFTDKRLILVDKQGMTGRKREYHSVPYRAITMFTIETAGHFDVDSELKIWVSGQDQPLVRELSRGSNIPGIQKALAEGVLGGR